MEPKRQIDGVYSSRPKPVNTGKMPLTSSPKHPPRTLFPPAASFRQRSSGFSLPKVRTVSFGPQKTAISPPKQAFRTGKRSSIDSKPHSKKRALSKRPILILVSALIAVGLILGLYKIVGGNTSLVPKNIRSSVDFPVYYPDIKKLPAGYTLDTKSFRFAEPGVVLYAVTYGSGKSITFSEEQQPSSNDIKEFINGYIPVNTVLSLSLGQATIGAYGSAPNLRTVASLPIHDGPWLIITAPPDVNRDDLAKIMKSLTE